jgi:gamma-glutamylcysteine synthetase
MATTMDDVALKAFVATIPAMPVEKRVKLFLKTRAAKSEAQKSFDEQEAQFKQIMEACQNTMLADADKQGITGFKTPFGTTYADETVRYSIADGHAFYTFVQAQKDLDFLERRVSSTHVKEYMEANGGTLPPGLSVFRERVMRVRKAGK